MEKLPILTGEKVVLRPITDADTDNIVRWRNTPSVRDNFIFRQTFTPEMHRNWLKTKVATGEVVQYIIVDKAADTAVGAGCYRGGGPTFYNVAGSAFFGEGGGPGEGVWNRAARPFSPVSVSPVYPHHISRCVGFRNTPARRSYAAAGFVEEGTFRDMVRLDGVYRDVVFMAKIAQ